MVERNRGERPQLQEGEALVDRKVVETLLKESEWYCEVEHIATFIAFKFGGQDGGWYVGDQLRKGTAKDDSPGLYVQYDDQTEEVHTKLDIDLYGSDWFFIANVS